MRLIEKLISLKNPVVLHHYYKIVKLKVQLSECKSHQLQTLGAEILMTGALLLSRSYTVRRCLDVLCLCAAQKFSIMLTNIVQR
jgi:hypothetical protein